MPSLTAEHITTLPAPAASLHTDGHNVTAVLPDGTRLLVDPTGSVTPLPEDTAAILPFPDGEHWLHVHDGVLTVRRGEEIRSRIVVPAPKASGHSSGRSWFGERSELEPDALPAFLSLTPDGQHIVLLDQACWMWDLDGKETFTFYEPQLAFQFTDRVRLMAVREETHDVVIEMNVYMGNGDAHYRIVVGPRLIEIITMNGDDVFGEAEDVAGFRSKHGLDTSAWTWATQWRVYTRRDTVKIAPSDSDSVDWQAPAQVVATSTPFGAVWGAVPPVWACDADGGLWRLTVQP